MFNHNKILAIIPARGGSKGIKNKNLTSLLEKSLLYWTITEAQKSKFIDKLILSSDNSDIINEAKHYGCDVPFVRPSELAKDDTPNIDPIIHAITSLCEKFDYVMMLQCTSPLRIVEDIDKCIEYCMEREANSCVSVTEPDKSPYWMFQLNKDEELVPLIQTKLIPRRQDLPPTYVLNGSIYFAKVEVLQETKSFITENTLGYVMPQERSADIDTEKDIKYCELLLRDRMSKDEVVT